MAATTSRTPVAVARALDGLGRDLGTWRKLRHLTVEQVADRAGVSRSTVLRLESGQQRLELPGVPVRDDDPRHAGHRPSTSA